MNTVSLPKLKSTKKHGLEVYIIEDWLNIYASGSGEEEANCDILLKNAENSAGSGNFVLCRGNLSELDGIHMYCTSMYSYCGCALSVWNNKQNLHLKTNYNQFWLMSLCHHQPFLNLFDVFITIVWFDAPKQKSFIFQDKSCVYFVVFHF